MSRQVPSLLAGLVFLLVGSGQVFLSLRLPGGIGISAAEPGPGLFPLLVGGMMSFTAVALIFQTWQVRSDEGSERHAAPVDIVLLVTTIAGYILLLPRAGFAISAFLMLMGTLSIYGMPGFWRRIATSAAATIVSHLVFTFLLGVNMPEPTWFR